jgi:hypothetical protein
LRKARLVERRSECGAVKSHGAGVGLFQLAYCVRQGTMCRGQNLCAAVCRVCGGGESANGALSFVKQFPCAAVSVSAMMAEVRDQVRAHSVTKGTRSAFSSRTILTFMIAFLRDCKRLDYFVCITSRSSIFGICLAPPKVPQSDASRLRYDCFTAFNHHTPELDTM